MTMRFAALGLLVAVAGCAPLPTVALQATPADLELLAGEWEGEYESAALGRRGIIEFTLKAGTDEARGDVVMVPNGRRMPYRPQRYEDVPHSAPLSASEILTIKFIRSADGSIAGMLDRYWDPDRECFANTAFNGRLGVGIVEGTFRTTFECGTGDATGTWSAAKKRAKPSAAWR